MLDVVREILLREPGLAFALVFGSRARGTHRADSDLDIAIGMPEGAHLPTAQLGALLAALESGTRCHVDIVIVSEAPIPLRFAVFRDGVDVIVRDRGELVRQKAQAIIDYLDFRPVHDRMVEGALKAAARG